MPPPRCLRLIGYLVAVLVGAPSSTACRASVAQDPLASWNDGPSKKAVTGFVSRVTQQGGPDFVTDGDREWPYDRTSQVGQLARGLDEAGKRGWVVVDMKSEWRRIYPYEP